MTVKAPDGPVSASPTLVPSDWPAPPRGSSTRDPSVEANPDLPPALANTVNPFCPQPLADNSSVSATSPGSRVASTTMLPEGADTLLARGGHDPAVAATLAAAVDHLDAGTPADSLDITMTDILGKFYATVAENPERTLALCRAIDEAFA